ncbi:MAG: SDR family oxidoreductase [Chloroflexi bacterium]|nr:SDR family oxidoreductase [Chloroflexota bacterium]
MRLRSSATSTGISIVLAWRGNPVSNPVDQFRLDGKVAVVTGGCGVLCFAMARFLAQSGARVALLDIQTERAEECACEIGEQAASFYGNVLERDSLEAAAQQITDLWGPADILINCAGGNRAQATSSSDLSFFDIPPDALQWVLNLNFVGTVLPSQVFGKQMADRGSGVVLNVSSMSAFRPLTRIVSYSAAKAAVSNFTQWLAVHMAQEYSPDVRVNAIAPGFFLTEQNRYLLTDKDTGDLTARGQQILDHTPMARFGTPEDLLHTVLWLVSPASAFVSGIVVPVDGGFSAYSGV